MPTVRRRSTSALETTRAAFAATGSVDKALADAGDDDVVGHAEFGGELVQRPVGADGGGRQGDWRRDGRAIW